MFRAGIAVAALAAFIALAPEASAQYGSGGPIGTGLPVPAAAIPQRAGPGTPGIVYFPVAMPWGWGYGWATPTYNPWTGYGYSVGGLVPPEGVAPPPVVVTPPPRPEPVVVLVNEFPATLTVQFPAAAEVWFDGKKIQGAPATEWVFKSPVLKPDQKYAFLVKAQWANGGKVYEAQRTVALGSGDRSRLLIVSGEEVKETERTSQAK